MEIEDSVLADLQKKAAGYDTALSFQQMFDKIGKGKNRTKLLELVKEDYPDIVIPEIDAAKPIHDEIAKLREELATERKARTEEKETAEKEAAERKANRTIADSRRALREDGWDDEGIEKIETYMRETSNPDYKSAAAYIRSQLPPEKPLSSTYAGQRFDWFTPPTDGADNHNLLMKNPRAFQDAEIGKFLAEQRGRRNAA